MLQASSSGFQDECVRCRRGQRLATRGSCVSVSEDGDKNLTRRTQRRRMIPVEWFSVAYWYLRARCGVRSMSKYSSIFRVCRKIPIARCFVPMDISVGYLHWPYARAHCASQQRSEGSNRLDSHGDGTKLVHIASCPGVRLATPSTNPTGTVGSPMPSRL